MMAEEKTRGAGQTKVIWKQKHRKVMLFWTSLDLWLPLSLAYANGQGTEMLLVEMNLAWTCAVTLDSRKPRNHRKATRAWTVAHILNMATRLLYHKKGKKERKKAIWIEQVSPSPSSSKNISPVVPSLLSTTTVGHDGNQQKWYFLFQNKQVWAGRLSLSGIWGLGEILEPLNSKDASQRNSYCFQPYT